MAKSMKAASKPAGLKGLVGKKRIKVLESLALAVHTPESFGRTLLAEVISGAANAGPEGATQDLKINIVGPFCGANECCIIVEVSFDSGRTLHFWFCGPGPGLV